MNKNKGIHQEELDSAIDHILPELLFAAEYHAPNTFRAQLECFVKEQIYYSGGEILLNKQKHELK